jgi:hypothetical protein
MRNRSHAVNQNRRVATLIFSGRRRYLLAGSFEANV